MTGQSYRSFLNTLEEKGDRIRFDKELEPLANMAIERCRMRF